MGRRLLRQFYRSKSGDSNYKGAMLPVAHKIAYKVAYKVAHNVAYEIAYRKAGHHVAYEKAHSIARRKASSTESCRDSSGSPRIRKNDDDG
jgi:hypothetical protein